IVLNQLTPHQRFEYAEEEMYLNGNSILHEFAFWGPRYIDNYMAGFTSVQKETVLSRQNNKGEQQLFVEIALGLDEASPGGQTPLHILCRTPFWIEEIKRQGYDSQEEALGSVLHGL